MHINQDALTQILKDSDIDPQAVLQTDNGQQTAINFLEAAVMGALDEIEELIDAE